MSPSPQAKHTLEVGGLAGTGNHCMLPSWGRWRAGLWGALRGHGADQGPGFFRHLLLQPSSGERRWGQGRGGAHGPAWPLSLPVTDHRAAAAAAASGTDCRRVMEGFGAAKAVAPPGCRAVGRPVGRAGSLIHPPGPWWRWRWWPQPLVLYVEAPGAWAG